MNIIPDIAVIVDREWYGARPPPSVYGPVEAVRQMPPEFRGAGWRPHYWQVCIAGQWWGIRPSDPIECEALDMFARASR